MRMQQPAGFGPRPAFTALTALVLAAAALIAPAPARAQTFPTDDAVIQQMWQVGMEQSQTEELAHYLMDYIGPRLAGSENLAAAQEWLLETYASWGVPARKEQYGTWNGWREGITHVDMIAPWVRTLEAKQLAWSPPSGGPVEGEVLALPAVAMEADTADWLPLVKDKWVMLMLPQQMCRAKQELEEWARPETAARIDSVRASAPSGSGCAAWAAAAFSAASRRRAPSASSAPCGPAAGACSRHSRAGPTRFPRWTSRARTTACCTASP
jgi:hypothetical protein